MRPFVVEAEGNPRRSRQTAVLLFAALSLAASAAHAQRLWTVDEATRPPGGPAVVVDGVAAPSSPGLAGLPQPTRTAEVQVTFDFLRLGFGYLELPLPDGSVIEAENAVFEDRGGGNLMWTGEVPGAGYESVLFTVQDGHLVGWFGEPGGPKYMVHAKPDGRGSLAEQAGPAGDWCGVGQRPERLPGRGRSPVERGGPADGGAGATSGSAGAASDRLGAVASGANGDRLDILLLYTTGTERHWRTIGGPSVGVQQLSDYLNMVFRNGTLPATANLIPERWDPVVNNHPDVRGGHFLRRSVQPWHFEYQFSSSVSALRERHGADLVHFVPEISQWTAGGVASVRQNLEPEIHTGWSLPIPSVFAHEIGHNLGGRHEPVTFGGRFAEVQRRTFRPYAFAHTDLTSCTRRESRGDALVCPATTISYGQDTWADPDRTWSVEPFYSSVRHSPNGWTIGLPDEREVERVLHETIPVAVRSGEESSWLTDQFPAVKARWTGRETVRVTWSEGLPEWASFVLYFALDEGANDSYFSAAHDPDPDPDLLQPSRNVTRIVDSDGAVVGADVEGLRPAGGYRVAVKDYGALSEPFVLKPPEPGLGSPAAPSRVGAEAAGSDGVRLTWAYNSNDESGFEIWYRKWSGWPDEVWRRHELRPPADARSAEIGGLVAEEEIEVDGDVGMRGRYSFVVLAHNDRGFSASEDLHIEFMPGAVVAVPDPPTDSEPGDCRPSSGAVCLQGSRYEVTVDWWTADGQSGTGQVASVGTADSGLFWFFGPTNWELLVKVLDACGVNGHHWVFGAATTDLGYRVRVRDTESGRVREYLNEPGQAAQAIADVTAFPEACAATGASVASRARNARDAPGSSGLAGPFGLSASPGSSAFSGASQTGDPNLVLQKGRFDVRVQWTTEDGETGPGSAAPERTVDSGLFWFFEPSNWEMLVKVLDGCALNDHYWVLAGSATTLGFEIVVTDTQTDTERRYAKTDVRERAAALVDSSAFPCRSSR